MSDPETVFAVLLPQLEKRRLAYVHLVEPRVAGNLDRATTLSLSPIRSLCGSLTVIVAGGHTAESGIAAVDNGDADLVAYGRLYIANPDLPIRIRDGAPMNTPNPSTFYGGGPEGYTDYPFLSGSS